MFLNALVERVSASPQDYCVVAHIRQELARGTERTDVIHLLHNARHTLLSRFLFKESSVF